MSWVVVGVALTAMFLIVASSIFVTAAILLADAEGTINRSGYDGLRRCLYFSGLAALMVLLLWKWVTQSEINSMVYFGLELLICTVCLLVLSMIAGKVWVTVESRSLVFK